MNTTSPSQRPNLALLLCLLLSTINICRAANYYIETNGLIGNTGLHVTSAWPNVWHAVDKIADGDIIHIGEGTFSEYAFIITNSIQLIGQDIYSPGNPPLTRHTPKTIIEYEPLVSQSTATVVNVKSDNVMISNITFDVKMATNVLTALYSQKGGLTVEYCTFRNINNKAGSYGILMKGTNSSPTPDNLYNRFRYNLFENIINTNASGIYLQRAPASVANNDFTTITGVTAQAAIQMNSCYLTNGSPLALTIDSNFIANCTQGIWANNFSNPTNKIYIRDNIISNCLVGIRVSSADGTAIITDNTIYVGGISDTTNETPARGVWIQADTDPWNTSPTDHQIVGNQITDISTNAGTVGVLLEYNDSRQTNGNNGVVATVLNNSISDFDIGLYVEAGTNGVTYSNSPLVSVIATGNDINIPGTWAIFAEGMTNDVIATNNWLGTYDDPSTVVSGNVYYSNSISGGALYLDTDGDGTNDYLDIDDDGDMLSDTSEVAIGTSPLNADTDFDNQNDFDEHHITGTNPLDNKSVFKFNTLSINADAHPVFTWPSISNRLYSIYRTTDISAGFPTPLTNNIAPDPSGTNTYIDTSPPSATQFFYQIVVTNTAF